MRGRLRGALAGALALAVCLVLPAGAGATGYAQTGVVGAGLGAAGGVAIDQSNGNLYLAELFTSEGLGTIARFELDEAGEYVPASTPTMGEAVFTSVTAEPVAPFDVYATTTLFGTTVEGFSQAGAALASPFPFPFSDSTVIFPQIAATPNDGVLRTMTTENAVNEFSTATGTVGNIAQTLTCSACPAPTQFANPRGAAVDAAGNIYVANEGGAVNEFQKIFTEASGGNFKLTIGGQTTLATGTGNLLGPGTGTGDVTKNSTTITNVVTDTGAFAVGQSLAGTGIGMSAKITAVGAGTLTISHEANATNAGVSLSASSNTVTNFNTSTGTFLKNQAISGTGIPAGTTIAAISGNEATLSQAATASGTGVSLTGEVPSITYGASAGAVGTALEAIPLIGVGNIGTVIVLKAGGPYAYGVGFTGALAGTDVTQVSIDGSGLTGTGATASVTTLANGGNFAGRIVKFGPQGDSDPTAPTVFAADPAGGITVNPANGHVFASRDDGAGWHIVEYDAAGNEISDFGLGSFDNSSAPQLAVDADNGTVFAVYSNEADDAGHVLVFSPIAAPEATTDPATGVTGNSATLNGKADPNGLSTEDCHFEYVTKTAFEATEFTGASTVACSPDPEESADPVAVSATAEALSGNTTYVYRLVEETEGGKAEGDEVEFTTLSPKPKATTETASGVSQTKATLNGKVDAEGDDADCSFQYGTTVAYGTTVPCSVDPVTGTTNTAVSAALSGLSPGTTYHYRVVATNGGGTTNGADKTFATPADTCATNAALCPPPPVVTPPVTTTPPPVTTTPPTTKKPLKCKKGFKKKRVKGKQKCVKVKKKKKK